LPNILSSALHLFPRTGGLTGGSTGFTGLVGGFTGAGPGVGVGLDGLHVGLGSHTSYLFFGSIV